MSQEQEQFDALLVRLRHGDQDAFWEILDRYGSYVRRVVRQSLDPRLRSKFDSVDLIQAIWASFFRRREEVDFLGSPDNLLGFLAAVARNKAAMERRKYLATGRHDVRREQRLDGDDVRVKAAVLPSSVPSPSQLAIAREKWDSILEGKPAHYREIATLRLSGMTYAEIGTALDINEKTARRVIEQLLQEHER